MMDHSTANQRKNRVNLLDYDYEKDLHNRLVVNSLSSDDVSVLEEILFNSVHFPIEELKESTELSSQELQDALDKLLSTKLISLDGDTVHVDKDMRKYFESQLERFETDFSPNLDFVQTLLKQIPIHILPNWYQVPKTSNNIFDSLVEKYFHTPQLFERYLQELNLEDEVLQSIIDTVFSSPNLQVPASELIEKLSLTETQFEEYMLILEYSFVLFSKFVRSDKGYEHVIRPFHEWREYLQHVQKMVPKQIDDEVHTYRSGEYPFSTDMALILTLSAESTISLTYDHIYSVWNISPTHFELVSQAMGGFDLNDPDDAHIFESYTAHIIQKLLMLGFASVEESSLKPSADANEWMEMEDKNRAFAVYKHPRNTINSMGEGAELGTERNIREIEKSIARVADSGWVYFDDFMEGLMAPISENSRVELRRVGRAWKYHTPEYTEEEKHFIQVTILEWLFESGIIATGTCSDRICFRVTELGNSLFGA